MYIINIKYEIVFSIEGMQCMTNVLILRLYIYIYIYIYISIYVFLCNNSHDSSTIYNISII